VWLLIRCPTPSSKLTGSPSSPPSRPILLPSPILHNMYQCWPHMVERKAVILPRSSCDIPFHPHLLHARPVALAELFTSFPCSSHLRRSLAYYCYSWTRLHFIFLFRDLIAFSIQGPNYFKIYTQGYWSCDVNIFLDNICVFILCAKCESIY
jgi:hypothetical protein